MHARVSTYKASGGGDQMVEGFRSVKDALEHMDGFSHAYFLVDRERDKAISITIWESEQALADSARQADELRKRGVEAGRGSVESVAHFEIAMTAGKVPQSA